MSGLATPAIAQLGATVWSCRRFATDVRGTQIQEQYGHAHGTLWQSERLRLRRARRRWWCDDCGRAIAKGELHGSAFYRHFCADCITPEAPAEVFRTAWSLADDLAINGTRRWRRRGS